MRSRFSSHPPRTTRLRKAQFTAGHAFMRANGPTGTLFKNHTAGHGAKFAGRKTASGEFFNPATATAKHRTRRSAIGAGVQPVQYDTDKVRINGREPFKARHP